MKRILTLLLLVGSASAQLAPVNVAGNGSSAASVTVTTVAPTPGNTLVAFVFYFGSDTLTIPSGWTISGSGGSCPQENYSGQAICMLQKPVAASPPTAYTFSQSGADGISAIVYEIHGADSTVVNVLYGGSAGGGPLTPPSAIPTVTGTLAIEVFSPSNATSATTPAGWTLDESTTGSPYHSAISIHRNALTTDTTTPIQQTLTISPTVPFSSAITVLIEPGTPDPHPVAYTTGPYSCIVNVPCLMNGSGSYDPNGLSLTYAWTFGDGGTSTAANPSHTYTTTGSKSVGLTVTNTTPLSGSTSTTASVSPPQPILMQSVPTASVVNHAPLVCAYPTQPNVNDLLTVIVPYPTNPDVDYIMPDASWSYSVGGRTGGSTNAYNRFGIFTHTVVPGDGLTYTFYPNPSTGFNTVSGMCLETYDTLPPAIAYGLVASSASSLTTPSLTPTVTGSLPIAGATNTSSPTPSTGFTTVTAPFTLAQGTLTPDASTPVAATFTGYSGPDTLTFTLMYPPGQLAAAPTASPAAGSYGSTQTVTLTAGQPIHVALDAGLATCSSPLYTAPLVLDRTTTVSAISCGSPNSAPVFLKYVIGAGTRLGIGLDGDLHGYIPWPTDAWHQNVTGYTIDPNSASIISRLSATSNHLLMDGGVSYVTDDSTPGKPYSTPLTNVQPNTNPADTSYGGEYGLLAIPVGIPIECNPPASTLYSYCDQHATALDRGAGTLNALWRTSYGPVVSGGRPTYFAASVVALYDLDATSPIQRLFSAASETAGGVPEFEALPRWDEMQACLAKHAAFVAGTSGTDCSDFGHALRITYDLGYFDGEVVGTCQGYFALPESHAAGYACRGGSPTNLSFYGQRSRLSASTDISSLPPDMQVVANSMKRYGFLADDVNDSGYTFSVNYAADPRWDQTHWTQLNSILASSLEVLAPTGTLYSAAHLPPGASPTINSFTGPSSVAAGAPLTLNWNTTNQTYVFINGVGFVRGNSITTTAPTAAGSYTYTLTAQGVRSATLTTSGDPAPTTQSLTFTVTAPTTCQFLCGNIQITGRIQ